MAEIRYEDLLALSKAHYGGETSTGLTDDSILRVSWENIPKRFLENAVDWELANRPYLEAPTIEYKTFDGFWRSVRVDTPADREGVLVHTFAYGYITELVTDGTLVWTEARLANAKKAWDTEAYLLVEWPNVSPSHVETIKDSIDDLTVGSFAPTIKGQAYGTEFHRLYVASKIVGDGSAVISLQLAKPEYTLTAYSNWLTERKEDIEYHYNVPKELAQGVIDAWKAIGRSATTGYNSDQNLVDIILRGANATLISEEDEVSARACAYEETTDYYWGVPEANIGDYVIPANSAGWSYRRILTSNGDGTYDIAIISRQAQYRNYDEVLVRKSSSATGYEWQQLGLTTQTVRNISSAEVGKIKRQDYRYNEDCSKDVVTNEVTVTDQTSTSYEESPSTSNTSALHTENTSALTTPSSETGKVKRNTSTPTETGGYRTVEEVATPKDQTTTSEEHSSARDGTTTLHTESTTIADKSASSGTIRRVAETPTEAGNIRTSDEVITPKDQTATSYEVAPSRSTQIDSHTENSSALSTPSTETGKIKRSTNAPTEAGNYRTTAEVITPTDQTSTSEEHSAARSGTTALHTEGSTIVDKSASSGTVRTVTEIPTEAGNLRTTDNVVTPIDQTSTTYEVSPSRSSQTDLHTENASALTTPVSETGKIKRSTNAPTEAGNYRTAAEVTTPTDQTSTSEEHSSAADATTTLHTEGATIANKAAAAGTTRVVLETPTEAGNLRTQDRVVTPLSQTFEKTYTTRNGTASYKRVSHVAEATLDADIAALTNATENNLSGFKDETNYWDYILTKNPVAAGGSGVWSSVEWDSEELQTRTGYADTAEYRLLYYHTVVSYNATKTGAEADMKKTNRTTDAKVGISVDTRSRITKINANLYETYCVTYCGMDSTWTAA